MTLFLQWETKRDVRHKITASSHQTTYFHCKEKKQLQCFLKNLVVFHRRNKVSRVLYTSTNQTEVTLTEISPSLTDFFDQLGKYLKAVRHFD